VLELAFGQTIVRKARTFRCGNSPANNGTVGDAFPSAEVEAIDINAIALTINKFSPNVSPVMDDVEKSWVFEESSLDFIRAGNLLHSIKDRPRLFRECRR
jgi:ubiquinone/menaquinone biosynthesis C-methylase UbiE